MKSIWIATHKCFHPSLLVLVFLTIGGWVFAQQVVTIEDSYGGTGSMVYVPVHLSDGTNIGGVNATITFSPAVLSNVSFVGGGLLNGHIVDCNSVSSSEFRFIVYANPTISFNAGAGYIGYILAEISSSATPGTNVTVNVSEVALGTTSGQSVSGITSNNGVLHIVPAAFSFEAGAQGWQFAGTIFPFDEPAYTDQGGHLGLSAYASANCFSYWQVSDIPIQSGKVYRARWQVGSSVSNPDQTIQIRLRVNQNGSWQGWNRAVNSFNQQAPSASQAKWYDVFTNPVVTGSSDDDVTLAFDIMSFDSGDDTNSWLYLRELSLEEVSVTEGAQVASYDFGTGSEGWQYPGTITPFDAPMSSSTGGHLGLNANGSVNCFSYWQSPDVSVQDAKTYRARFTVNSSVSNADDSVQCRLRVNQNSSWQGWYRVVNSNNQQAPSAGTWQTYDVIFNPSVTGPDNSAKLCFDILSFDPGDDENSWLYLESATIKEITVSP